MNAGAPGAPIHRQTGPQPGSEPAGSKIKSFVPPALSLPTGGGALRGIDETFQVNQANGTGTAKVAIATSPSRQGLDLKLALTYNSGGGNGPFGLGWDLAMPHITRKTDKGLPTYEDTAGTDTFVFSGAEDLVPVLTGNGESANIHSEARDLDGVPFSVRRYRPRIEGSFARIEHWTDRQTGLSHWRTISRENVTALYGRTSESRIADPADPLRIFSWLICERFDGKGNAILYRYKSEDSDQVDETQVHERNRDALSRSANRYLKRIQYGNRTPRQPNEDLQQRDDWMFEVVLDYGEGHFEPLPEDGQGQRFATHSSGETQAWPVRQDPFSQYRARFEVRSYRLCRRILMVHHFAEELGMASYLVQATHFGYAESQINTLLTSVVQSGYQHHQDDLFQEQSLPALEFDYSRAALQNEVHEIEDLANLPVGVSGPTYRWVDLDSEGLAGILTQQGSGWYYKANLGGGRFAPQETIADKPSLAALQNGQQLLDLAGDGQLDLVDLDGPAPGFYERTSDRSWSPHRPFTALPSLDWNDANLRFIDLNGDGQADILITGDQVLSWYPSLAEAGYGACRKVAQATDEEQGPRLVFADASQSIYLADMSGDGLADLVRIRLGSICYWPNLGYGRFGAKVSMDHAPWFDRPDRFDHRRLRLADLDGSGITDLLYLLHDRVTLYFNQAGNSWSDASTIAAFPAVDDLSAVTVTDLLGNGTACLVWSSPLPGDRQHAMRYIDLMGGQKPHLLTGTRNNRGSETRIQYAPSTHFYLEDKAAGRPWITHIPFPVHVVARLETYDHISQNRFVSRYRYHHGYYDGAAREFRGFGLVEQIDSEEFAALNQSEVFPSGENVDESSHTPPVLTRSWYHTGAYLGSARNSRLFQDEYYREPGLSDEAFQRQLLPDTVMPPGLPIETEQEAIRALKGALLRQEIYGLDGSEREGNPYTVLEQNFTIKPLQVRGPNRHAVFLTHPRESLRYHYERNPSDPRVSHQCVLATDDFGNVLRSVTAGYGRRQADLSLAQADRDVQGRTLLNCSEHDFTNPVETPDAHRTPMPSQMSTFEMTGLELAPDQLRFSFLQLQQATTEAAEIAYHLQPDPELLQKRLLERTRTLYRQDDLSGPLPLGQIQSLALPYDAYRLAFTPEHLDLVFGDRIEEAMLSDEGRYVHFDGDGNWWIPSGRVFLSPNPADSEAEELAFAQAHFYLPLRFRNPFDQTVTLAYDSHDLLLTSATGPLQTSVLAENNYRFLVPQSLTDANGNRSAVVLDGLGRVTGTASLGKESESVGDSLEGLQIPLTQIQIDAFFADPRGQGTLALLGEASSRFIHDDGRFQRLGLPPFTATIVRETHVSDLGEGEDTLFQVHLDYSDGFNRLIQTKVQAEPGPVENGGQDVDPRWSVSGWTVFNNKGEPVKQYEPFFSADHEFEFGVTVGVSPTLFYDPLGRIAAILHPNHTWEKMRFDPWRKDVWDPNDTVLVADPAEDPDAGGFFARLNTDAYLPTWHQQRVDGALGNDSQDAAQKAMAHAETPHIVHFDSLGRPFLQIADNGPDGRYETRTEHDLEGNPLRIVDARGNGFFAYQLQVNADPPVPGYDLAGRRIYEISMDGGARRTLPDSGNKPIRHWDSRGHGQRLTYDALQRPTQVFLQPQGEVEILVEKTVYGETHPEAEIRNLRGQIYQIFDGAGVKTLARYDFKGNLVARGHRMALNYHGTPDWTVLADLTDTTQIEAASIPLIENQAYTFEWAYDAMNREVSATSPDNSVTLPGYNEANLLDQVAIRLQDAAQATPFVTGIDYNARGQRTRITYATSGETQIATTYDYDPETYRLTRLHTVRHADNRQLQDLNYTYDPVGNITSIRDHAQQVTYFNNAVVHPHCDYTYDATYRLTRAAGREHAVQNNLQRDATAFTPTLGIPFPNSPDALQRYVREYTYDSVGNMLSMQHRGGDVLRWTRRYQYASEHNRLLATSLPGDGVGEFSITYTHDAHGNMTTMPHLPLMRWDYKDQLMASSRQVVNQGTPETTYYAYNMAGQRARKVTERQAGEGITPTRRNERLYFDGFEVYREFGADGTTITLERETLHLSDDRNRFAQIDTRTQGNDGNPAQSRRYQFGNHLGSALLEADAQGQIISYEEYHPFGTTAYRCGRSEAEVSLKRYRFTGQERDEETGLNYHGARYFSCWLGQWTAVDPELENFTEWTPYAFGFANPVRYRDNTGASPEEDAAEYFGEKVGDYLKKVAQTEEDVDRVFNQLTQGHPSLRATEMGKRLPDKIAHLKAERTMLLDQISEYSKRNPKSSFSYRRIPGGGGNPHFENLIGKLEAAGSRLETLSLRAELTRVASLMARSKPSGPGPGKAPKGGPKGGEGKSPKATSKPSPSAAKGVKAGGRTATSTAEKALGIGKKAAGRAKGNILVAAAAGTVVGVGTLIVTGDTQAAKQATYETINPIILTTEVMRGNLDIPVSEALYLDLLMAAASAGPDPDLSRETREVSEWAWENNPAFNPAFNPKQ